MKLIDRTGQVFGKLTALEQVGRDALKKVLWRCKCECGNETIVPSGSLATGNTTSCGCVVPNLKHGGWKKSSYNTWRAMIRRCTVPTDKDYPRYGGRGVSVCTKWLEYANFVADMGEPVGDETLDRIDAYGNYEPTNYPVQTFKFFAGGGSFFYCRKHSGVVRLIPYRYFRHKSTRTRF